MVFSVRDETVIKDSTGKLAPSLDTKSAGYIVAPPGPGRSWEMPEGRAVAIAELPKKWLARLESLSAPAVMPRAPATQPQPMPAILPPARETTYAKAALAGEVEAVRTEPDGTGNNRLNVAGCKMGGLIGAGAIDRSAVEDALLLAAVAAGQPEKSARATIASGINAGLKTPRAIPADPQARARAGRDARAIPSAPDSPQSETNDRLSVLSPSEIIALELPHNDNLLADRLLARAEALAMFGSGGLGKSLLTLNLAIDTILGRPWCGFETHGLKTRWLVFSPENGLRRDKRDLRGILRDTSQDERDLLDKYLRVHVPIEERDRYMNFSDPANVRRMMYEVQAFKPDVVVFDPLIEFFQGENENDSTQMRECYQMMMRIARTGLPDAAAVIAHHARAGKNAIRGALGFDAANFGRGSKALFSSVRGAINVAPTDEKDSNRLLLAPSKCNNGRLPDPVAVRRDPDTLRHEIDPDFSWEEFETQTAEKRSTGGAPKKCTLLHVVTSLRAADGPGLSHAALVRALQALAPCSEPTAKRAVSDAKEHGDIVLMNGVYSITKAVSKPFDPI